jgi:chromosome partitioning protein
VEKLFSKFWDQDGYLTSLGWDAVQAGFTFIGAAFAVIGFFYSIPRIRRELERLRKAQSEATSAVNKLERIENVIGDEDVQLWLRDPIKPTGYDEKIHNSKPIITVANLKGGVGKTTITANLAAALASQINPVSGESYRVLVIDLDWQGSLSALMIGQGGFSDVDEIDRMSKTAEKLISGEGTGTWAMEVAKSVERDIPSTRFLASNYRLATMENNVLFRWLLEKNDTDARYHLASVLLDKEVQDNVDYILLDAPPRLTTATMNALCSSTHVLVPTILDRQSTNGVFRFLRQLDRLQGQLFPRLKPLGVLASMSVHWDSFAEKEIEIIGDLKLRLNKTWNGFMPFLDIVRIRRDVFISDNAGQRLAYFHDSDRVKGGFNALAKEVIKRTARHEDG